MNLSEQLDDARSGNTAAQKYLFDLLADPMMAVCCRYVKNRADAEELLLDGFYKFYSHLAEFRYQGEAALYVWIKTIMVRECLMFLRRRHAFSMLVRADGDTEAVSCDSDALSTLSAAEIFDLIVQLPVGYRTVFNLHVMEGMEHKEIAKALGISEGTSRSQLSKAKQLLQKMLFQKGVRYVKRKNR
jgi:RNA polymerase sigma factor (sigma-70 family)